MKTNYKGYDIKVNREKNYSPQGEAIYYSVARKSDGLVIIASFTQAEDPLKKVMEAMKERVDSFIETEGVMNGMV